MRFLKNILTGLSLLLCLAAIGLWIACNWNVFYLYYRSGDLTKSPRTDYGTVLRPDAVQLEGLIISNSYYVWPSHGPLTYGREVMSDSRSAPIQCIREPDISLFGLGYGKTDHEYRGEMPELPEDTVCNFITLPYWFLTLLFAIAPAWGALAAVRRNRRKSRSTLCIKCGYDLRASTDRCPECGTPIPTANRTGVLPSS